MIILSVSLIQTESFLSWHNSKHFWNDWNWRFFIFIRLLVIIISIKKSLYWYLEKVYNIFTFVKWKRFLNYFQNRTLKIKIIKRINLSFEIFVELCKDYFFLHLPKIHNIVKRHCLIRKDILFYLFWNALFI